MKKPLPWLKPGEVLTAKLFNTLIRRLNEHEKKLATKPKQ